MTSRTIRLAGVKDIKELCNAAVEMPFDIDILSGNYIIDAKSIMGIFSLDLNQPMTVRIDADDAKAQLFLQKIAGLCK
ncbi:HPr family phosphocarrier protein [Intestinibacillus massiliensis]|nr:HPr family phosphocarrier protein [Intestinibacillus massiliensis]